MFLKQACDRSSAVMCRPKGTKSVRGRHTSSSKVPTLQVVVSSRLSQVTPFIAIAQLNFIKESTSFIHNTILGISNTTFT